MLLYASNHCTQEWNTFFYPNMCHICKKFGKINETDILRNSLKTCGGCKMIFYCCRDHQKVHWAAHKDFCKAVQDVRENCAEELSAAEGEKARMKLLQQKVTSKLPRKLRIYEMQMFKYAKMCRYCGEANDELQYCSKCLSVSFCKKHANKHEEDACSQYRMTFMSEMTLSPNRESFHWTYINFAESCHLDSDMETFLTYFNDELENDELACSLFAMEQSRHFTRVMSVYQGLEILNLDEDTEKLVLHCIGATKMKERPIAATFEILFHLYPSIQFIHLVLIGPGLADGFGRDIAHTVQKFLCIPCRRESKEFYVQYCDTTYSEYMKYEETRVEPDYVIGFNCHFHEYDIGEKEETWAESIKIIAELNKPLILTCHSKRECDLTTERINLVLEKEIAYLHCEKNPYAAMTLFREYESKLEDDSANKDLKEIDLYPVYHENEYLLIYENLCNKKHSFDSKNSMVSMDSMDSMVSMGSMDDN